MKFNIFDKHYQYIGLHLNAHALKALQFFSNHNKTTVKGLTNNPMPKGLIQGDTFVDGKKLSEFIKIALGAPQHGTFTTDRVVVSLPESKTFIRVIEMKEMPEDQAENAILFEAEAYIPMPMDQVYFDWQIISRKDGTMDVLVVASPKDFVDSLMKIIEDAGLKLCAIEADSQSIARALVPPSVDEPVLVANIDALKTALIKVEHGSLQFTSTVPLAGNLFTERLVKDLNFKPNQAEDLKKNIGFANTVEYPNLKTILMPAVEDLASELKTIFKYHYEHSDTHINQLLLTGGGAKLKHLSDALLPLLDTFAPLEVTVANPLEHIPNLEHCPISPYEALSFTTAIGLAMWGINDHEES